MNLRKDGCGCVWFVTEDGAWILQTVCEGHRGEEGNIPAVR